MKLSTRKSSATFETIEVNEIGRKCWFISFTGLSFGSGTISACVFPRLRETNFSERGIQNLLYWISKQLRVLL